MSGRVDNACPILMKVGPSASRSVTNSSGLPSMGVSPSGTVAASMSSPVNTPALRYFRRKRRICALRAIPVGCRFIGAA